MRLLINHETKYTYDTPTTYALQQARLMPKQRNGQKILSWHIDIDGGKIETSYADQNNNHVDLISVDPGGTTITIKAHGEVEISDTAGIVGEHGGFTPLWLFKRQTELTNPGTNVRRIAKKLPDNFATEIERLHALSKVILSDVPYKTGETNAITSAEEAIKNGCGVCQDHAHIFISVARILGYPARYVSGYLMINDRVEQDATHAWAEVHIDGLGWVGFDVSNGISPDERYVRVATGADFNEASPISGMRYSQSTNENMLVTIQVEQ